NWFFKLTAYGDAVRDLVKNSDFVEPVVRRNEVLAVLEEGLEDISISRAKTSWAVTMPGDPDHVMYVWFDALINYITGVGFPGGARSPSTTTAISPGRSSSSASTASSRTAWATCSIAWSP